MQRKIKRRERLLALALAFVMVFTSMSSSISMAVSGHVTSATRAEVASGSVNYGFKLKDNYRKFYDATCMEPSNDSIPADGDSATLVPLNDDCTADFLKSAT